MTSRTLRLSDGRLVRLIDQGAGATVLMIHGVGMCAEAWMPQIDALSGNARVIAVDMPGHGGSAALCGKSTLPDYVDWAAEVIEALGLGPVAVVGHSMGALISAGLAIERPDLVSRAALLNIVFRRNAAARRAVLDRAAEIASGTGSIEGPLSRWFTPEEGKLREQVAGWLRSASHAGYAAAYRAFAEGDATYADRMQAIGCPLLVMTADGDANSTPEMTFEVARLAPQGRAVVIPGHRHMLNLTAPQIVSEELQRWLASEETVG